MSCLSCWWAWWYESDVEISGSILKHIDFQTGTAKPECDRISVTRDVRLVLRWRLVEVLGVGEDGFCCCCSSSSRWSAQPWLKIPPRSPTIMTRFSSTDLRLPSRFPSRYSPRASYSLSQSCCSSISSLQPNTTGRSPVSTTPCSSPGSSPSSLPSSQPSTSYSNQPCRRAATGRICSLTLQSTCQK